jgi:hypothetical protein
MYTKLNIIVASLFSLLLVFIIFKWIDYLVENNYLRYTSSREGFDPNVQMKEGPDTNHNVDLPLTTSYSCKNMCGPPNRCSITGQQCFADIDCPGCEPYSPPLASTDKQSKNIVGDNAAGKLTYNATPKYSTLTTDIGTKARLITKDKYEKPVSPNFGVDTWKSKFDTGRKLFDDRYKPAGLKGMPSYPERYSLSGEFIEEGPISSNAYLS